MDNFAYIQQNPTKKSCGFFRKGSFANYKIDRQIENERPFQRILDHAKTCLQLKNYFQHNFSKYGCDLEFFIIFWRKLELLVRA